MIVCDKCKQCYHPECITKEAGFREPNDGPWYCKRCRTDIIMHGHTDLIEDLALLDLLFTGKEPEGAEEGDRVAKLRGMCRAKGKEL
jgi:hypothetical protein